MNISNVPPYRTKKNINRVKERSPSRTRVFFILVLIFVVIAIIAIIYAKHSGWIDIDISLITAIATIALVVTAYSQLRRNHENQRGAFLSQYVSKIFTDKELSDTFHYLVYTYDDEMFCKVKVRLNEEKLPKGSGQKEMYQCLDPLQDGRGEGFRFYHPAMFLGSAEEKRLDSLLGYFNIIAYYCDEEKQKILSPDDINGSVGYHLTVMLRRNVIQEYMKLIREDWKRDGRHAERFGMEQPFHHLRNLFNYLELKRFENEMRS